MTSTPPNAFQRLTQARTQTGEEIKNYALLVRDLESLRKDREASAEDVFEAAQKARRAEARMNEAIAREMAAVVAAEGSTE